MQMCKRQKWGFINPPTALCPSVVRTPSLREWFNFQCRQFFRPHHHVMLRGAPSGGDAWTLLDVTRGDSLQSGARELEKIEAHRAMSRIYPGCVHLSRHGQYKIERHDANARVAYCREYANPEVTYARERTAVMPLEKDPSAGMCVVAPTPKASTSDDAACNLVTSASGMNHPIASSRAR